ncbi:MAG: FAD-dependent oxidoreductase [Nostoc sp.]
MLCTDGPADLTDEQRRLLVKHNIPVREEKIDRSEGKDGHLNAIVFADTVLARSAIYLHPLQQQRSELPKQLGCDIENGFVKVDECGQTSIQGVYTAGDMITPMMQSLPYASFSGGRAAGFINQRLLAEDFDSSKMLS